MNLNDLRTFVIVADAGSFSAAADRLGVPRSTVTRRVHRLEEELGVALLNRSGRAFTLSDDGRWVVERSGPAFREIAQMERGLDRASGEPTGRLRLTAPIDLGATTFLAELVAAYTREAPQVRVSLEVANRHLDLLEDGVDLALRLHSRPLPSRDDLVARTIGQVSVELFASPCYVGEHGSPTCPEDLARHRVLAQSTLLPAGWGVEPVITANDFGPLAAMAVAGAGIAALPGLVAEGYLERSELVRLPVALPEWPAARMSLVWLRTRQVAPRVRRFVELAVDHARASGLADRE